MFKKSKILLLSILFLGLFLRIFGNNWDQGWHLHPDERFLTMVGIDTKIPPTLDQYLDQKTSTFNPVNKGHAFFVYGTFPILINKILAQYFYNDTYDFFHLQGRALSGVADFLVILVLFKLIELCEKKLKFSSTVKYLGAFFYAIGVLPIQLSHFFTVDTFLNLFCWLSFYFAVKLFFEKKGKLFFYISLSGFFFGCAVASKISAVYFAPLVGIFILFALPLFRRWYLICIAVLCFVVFFYFALRFGSPYYFETNNILNVQLSTIFLNSIRTLKSFDNPQGLFPPAIQWISKSYDFPIKNIFFFGVGPIYFGISLFGALLLLKKKNKFIISSILWIIAFIIYQSFQFAKTMRYLIFIYPFLAIFAAVGMTYILGRMKKIPSRFFHLLGISFIYISVVIWPLAFMSIYTVDQSRVTASHWIYETIPSRSVILTEYWDDPLPLMVQDPGTKNYRGQEVHIFDPDTKEKWMTINDQLSRGDYYIMSSNRAWGSIGEVPKIYPDASEFYKNMFLNKRGYTLIKKFTSYPSLRYLGIPLDFPDQWAEEAFTVYDHPEVLIFKKQ